MDLCKDSEEKQEAMEVNNDDVSPKAGADCVVPVTPDAVRENGDLQSPLTLTVVRKQLKMATIDSDNGSPQTPKDGVFDPFAPGPDNMAHAPQSNKYLDEFRNTVARRLNFPVPQHQNPFHDAEFLSDEDMFQSVYENLLQFIVSEQTEGVLAHISNVEYDSDDCKTPPSPLRFTGISDTCPGAPVKLAAKPRNIQLGLCKKLEF